MIKKIMIVKAEGTVALLKAPGIWKRLRGLWFRGYEVVSVSDQEQVIMGSKTGYLLPAWNDSLCSPNAIKDLSGFVEVTLPSGYKTVTSYHNMSFYNAGYIIISPLMRAGDLSTWDRIFVSDGVTDEDKEHLMESVGASGIFEGLLEKMCTLMPPDTNQASHLYIKCLEHGNKSGADWIASTMPTNEVAISYALRYSYNIEQSVDGLHGITDNMLASIISRVDILDTREAREALLEKIGPVSHTVVLKAIKLNPDVAKDLIPLVKGL